MDKKMTDPNIVKKKVALQHESTVNESLKKP